MESLTRKSLKHSINTILCSFLLCLFMVSCGEQNTIYSHFYELKDAEWAQKDILLFEIDSTSFEIGTPYTLTIEVTNNVNYPYKNIWFFSQDNIDNDSTFTKVSKEYKLADDFGKWTGAGFGTLYQSTFVLNEKVIFSEKRNYLFKLEHGMRDEPLVGIEKVGIKLTKNEK